MSKGVFGMVNLKQLAKSSGVTYHRLYEIINKKYDTLNTNEKTILANTLAAGTEELYKYLGFKQRITRIKDQVR